MKAITVENSGSGTALRLVDLPVPLFEPDEVVIEVAAAGVNRADLLQRAGKYPPPPGASPILGLEAAGVIAEVGNRVSGWNVGDRVCALLSGGGYSKAVAVPHQMLMPLPEGWSFEQGAAFPEAYYTAFLNLFIEGELKQGETVLIHGGASGVGTAAIQLAKANSATILVTAGSVEKTEACLRLGADRAINYRSADFYGLLESQYGPNCIDVILDPVGGSHFAKNIKLLRNGGRLIIIAVLGGHQTELNLASVLLKRLRIIGSNLRNRPLGERIEIRNRVIAEVWPLISSGLVEPVIDSVFPVEEAEKAHQHMAENRNIGKIVLTF